VISGARRGSVTPSATSFTNFLFEAEASQPNVGVGLRQALPGGNTGTKHHMFIFGWKGGLPTCDAAARAS
jgi:hypothetical protein